MLPKAKNKLNQFLSFILLLILNFKINYEATQNTY